MVSPAALGASGDRDAGFGGAAHGRVVVADASALAEVAVQPHGGIIAIGTDVSYDGIVMRLRPDGTRDTTFRAPVLTTIGLQAVAIDGKGRIVVAGDVANPGGGSDLGVWRLLPSGAPDTSFGNDGFATFGAAGDFDDVYDVAVDTQDRVLVAGSAVLDRDALVVRFTSDGTPDPTFNSIGGTGEPSFRRHSSYAFTGVAVQPDGKLVLTGQGLDISALPVYRVVPGDATATGAATLDRSFAGNGRAEIDGFTRYAMGLSLESGGGILVSGKTRISKRFALVRLTSHGEVDSRYGNHGVAEIQLEGSPLGALGVATEPDGSAAVDGSARGIGSFVARFDARGVPDPAMGPDGVRRLGRRDFAGGSVSLQPDGRILVPGTIRRSSDGKAVGGVVYRFLGGLKLPSCRGLKATIVGTKYADHLRGTGRDDVIVGLGRRDHISGLARNDVVCGGGGADVLRGGTGDDILFGGPGHDILKGGPGHDRLRQ